MNKPGALNIPANLLITPVYVFLLIHTMQVGVGILGFERYIAKDAGYDAWISILVGGVVIHLLLWMIYRILKNTDGDIVTVHQYVFGKYIGSLFNLVVAIYFLLLCLTVFRTFIEVIQVWVFPQLQIWLFSIVFLGLMYYIVIGGVRVITGMALMSLLLGLPLLLFKYFPIKAGKVDNVYPIIDHSIMELLASTKATTLSFLGIELLLVFYPFIKNKQASIKWAHFGVFYTTMIYLSTALVTFIYYSEEQLDHVIWPTVTLWKIVDFTFIQRFEFVGIAAWVVVVMPNVCLALWGASRIPKRMFRVKQRHVIWVFLLLLFGASILIEGRKAVDTLNNFTSEAGLYFLLYIPVLFLLVIIRERVDKRNES
ncbi:GerAB/ArcD/ProY family transporter [Thalassobacillus hwangdonensis]|uniref:GerAB/ArcD/ProY family transporter n=1 Tax=Thalassobacillus hwangdonensis TaxID=546108 RepID=A0ABW3L6E7_9BACI